MKIYHMKITFSRIVLLMVICTTLVSSDQGPPIYHEDANGKYFWFVDEDGIKIKAYVSGNLRSCSTRALNDQVQFYLYTNDNKEVPDELKVDCEECFENSKFDKDQQVKIICHGFDGSYNSDLNKKIMEAYFEIGADYNIIVVNWEEWAKPPRYDCAASRTQDVGEMASELLVYMVSEGYTIWTNIHFIGHSLGGHIGGITGSEVIKTTGQQLNRVTGLDPALPLFSGEDLDARLDSSDAAFVDVIHTDAGFLGFRQPIGKIDFYPNGGGYPQPGCGFDIAHSCCHSRAWVLFAESILSEEAFPSRKCEDFQAYGYGECYDREKSVMGEYVCIKAEGSYYLHTNSREPYSRPEPTSYTSYYYHYSY